MYLSDIFKLRKIVLNSINLGYEAINKVSENEAKFSDSAAFLVKEIAKLPYIGAISLNCHRSNGCSCKKWSACNLKKKDKIEIEADGKRFYRTDLSWRRRA